MDLPHPKLDTLADMTVGFLIVLLLGVGFWLEALRARESALRACRRLTARLGAQLLDETVALQRLRPARTAAGYPALRRSYTFEYSLHGLERRRGRIELLGGRVLSVQGDWIDARPVAVSVTPSPPTTLIPRRAPEDKGAIGTPGSANARRDGDAPP